MNDAALLYAVQDAAAGEYEVLGTLGRTERGTIVFLARELATATVVVMRLEPTGLDGAGVPQFSLDVLRELDESVPQLESPCPRCAKPLRKWARFCTKCGQDVSGVAASTGGIETRSGLRREAERVAAATGYEFIGEMPRAAGGGDVYFAKEPKTNRIVALRLTKEAGQNFELASTGLMAPVAPPPPPGGPPVSGSVGIVVGPSVRTSTTHPVQAAAVAARQQGIAAAPAAPAPQPGGAPPSARPGAAPAPAAKRRSVLWLLILTAVIVAAGAYVLATRS